MKCLLIKKLKFFQRYFQKLVVYTQKKPAATFLTILIVTCILLPLRCPSGIGYPYFRYSEIAADLVTCLSDRVYGSPGLQQCPLVPDNLGTFSRAQKVVNETLLANLHTKLNIKPGGHWTPSHCHSLHKTAIIVPYRNREHHLKIFLQHMHPFLQAQLLDYGIFIIEQSERHSFNRGKLFNIGFEEALKQYSYCCFIFHDIDLLPESPLHIYGCSRQPRHMCSALDTFRYVLPYKDIFGGVVAFTKEQYITINGYSNVYFGWGGEDDDLSDRLKAKDLTITRWEPKLSRYTMLFHSKMVPNPERFTLLRSGEERFEEDGLNSLTYKVLNVELKDLYTRILVDVKP